MRFVAPLLAVAFATVIPVFCAPATEVSRTPPAVYAERFAHLLTPLAEVMAGRTALEGKDSGGIVLLYEKIFFRGDDGLTYRVLHVVQHAVEQAGVERVANDIYTFDREREDIFLVDAVTIRADGERMPVEANGAFIQTPQHEAENSLYTSQAELNLIFPRVAPGSTTEAIVLIRENQPVMPGEFALAHTFSRGWPAFRQRLVLDFPAADLKRIRQVATGTGVPAEARDSYAPGRERLSWIRDNAPYIPWEENGPQFEYRGPTLWLTTLESWDAVASWFHGLVSGRSELGAELETEVDRWTEGLTDRTVILEKLTEKVANDVRYVGLEFGMAGYQPHLCEQVWRTRYGDCKDKANLLRAMLAHKGIAAHVVLIQTDGLGRVQKDSPAWNQFNHAILAVEGGPAGYVFCDPTIKYLPAGSIGLSDLGRDVLVVRDGRADWARTPDPLDSAIRIRGELALAADGALSGWFTLAAEGVDAAGYADHVNGLDRDGRLRWMQRVTEGFFPGADVIDVDYTPVEQSVRAFTVRAYFVRPPRASGDQSMAFPYPANWLPSVDTAGERRFPYVTRRREESVEVSISLPAGWGPRGLPATFAAPSAFAEFDASWENAPGRLGARLAWHPKQGALAASDYPVLQRSVRALTAWLEQPVVLEHSNSEAAPMVAAAGVELIDFPILPTGQGQLRLLNERYPERDKPAQRRVALQRILQWFPNDTETTFEAQVWLASLDWSDATEKQFADRVAALVEQNGGQVSPGLRSWAVYLESKARWAAGKDPAAIERLEQIAEDKNLTPFRRGWAAVYAGRFRREGDASGALAFMLRHDDYECEAREAIVQLIASLYAQVGDIAGAENWARQLTAIQAETGDGLIAAALETLVNADTFTSETARAASIGAMRAALDANEPGPKTAAVLKRWDQIVARRSAVAAYRDALKVWLEANRPEWWTAEKVTSFAGTAALEKHIDDRNEAKDARPTIDGIMQLTLHHQPEVNSLAQNSRRAMWWLRKQNLSPGLIDVIGRGLLGLSAEQGEDVIQAWHEYAVYLRASGRTDEARAIYRRVLDEPAAKKYQLVDAGGELGTIELKAGNVDAALAAFHRIVPVHTGHKWSVDYLYPAMLLHVGRGEYDEALALIENMREQEMKYIDGSDHKSAVKHLLRTAKQPEALRRYWERTANWINSWNAVLELNGIKLPAPHELPLEENFTAASGRIDKAASSKNINAYLREIDTYARIARAIPIFGSDFCTQADKAGRISASLGQRICTVGLALMAPAEPVDPEFDHSRRVWQSVMLGGVGRKDEAAACGRGLFDELGAEHPQGMAGLRLWVVYSRGLAGESEAVAQLEAQLAADVVVPERTLSARVLSDTYMLTKNSSAQRALLERETEFEGFDGADGDGKVLVTRLEELNTAALKGGELTAAINAWLESQDAGWLEHVAPKTLSEPRFATLSAPLTAEKDGVSRSEALKYNLLVAREEALPAETRVAAFGSAVFALAFHTNDVERFTTVYLSAAEIRLLPDERRALLVYNALSFLVSRGETRLAERVAASPAFRTLHEDRRASYRACHEALLIVDAGGADWDRRALAAVMGAPLDGLRSECIEYLVARLSFGGDFERAAAVVASTRDCTIDASVDLRLASLRLKWTRSIRRVQEQIEFARSLRAVIATVPGADAGIPEKIRRQINFGASTRLTDLERLAEAVCALEQGHLVGEPFASVPLITLQEAHDFRNPDPTLFPRFLELALTAPGTDADRSNWVMFSAFGCDIDLPEVRTRVYALLEGFQKSPEAASRPRTAQTVALIRGFHALRTERADRPAVVFQDPERSGVPENDRRGLELHYLVTRGAREESVRLAESLATETLMQPHVFRLARNGLLVAGHEGEVALLDEAMREQLARTMGNLWMNPDSGDARMWLVVARALDARDLVPPAWFDRAVNACGSEVGKGQLRAYQAHMQKDWPALRDACDAILRKVPDMYDAYYDRAVARYHLDDRAGARDDLRVMLTHALSNEDYQQALALFRELAPGETLEPIRH